jgi:hypothetical protein
MIPLLRPLVVRLVHMFHHEPRRHRDNVILFVCAFRLRNTRAGLLTPRCTYASNKLIHTDYPDLVQGNALTSEQDLDIISCLFQPRLNSRRHRPA